MGRAPTSSRVLLALGALTLAVLAWSLLAHTGTAAAHDADTSPHPRAEGAKDGKCPSETELGDHEDCIEGQSKTGYWHQNYWYPKVCLKAGRTDCDQHDTTVGLDGIKDASDKWHIWALRHTTSQVLDLFDERTNTKLGLDVYLETIERTLSLTNDDLSRCGKGNDSSRDAEPFDTETAAANANCGHSNPPHIYFDHQPTEETIATHTVFVDEHNHCDDGTHPADHPDGECPPDVCPVPAAPVVTVPTPKQFRNSRTQQKVEWTVNNPAQPCEITGQEIQYGTEAARTVRGKNTRESWERHPAPGSQIRVYVRVKNENPADRSDQWSDWGYDDLYGDTVCPLPAAPVVSWSATPTGRVSWTTPDAGGPSRSIGAYRIVLDPTGGLATDPVLLPTSPRWRAVTQPAAGQGPLTVLVGARNGCGWGEYGRVTVPAKQPTVTDCPKPDAPTVTKHNKREHPEKQQEVRWKVDDPEGEDCGITGWFIYYGTDPARRESAGTTSSYERQPVPGSRIRVFVRAENRVRPGSTAKQLGNSGDVDLYGDCPSGTTHAGKPMDDPAVGGTVEGCNDDDDGCAVPDAPVLLGPDSGTGYLQVVTWTVADPAGVGCEITGQELRVVPQRGISSTRDRDALTRRTTRTVNDRTGVVVVSVRAKNRVQPGGTDQQRGGLDTVKLDGQPHQTVSV